MERKARVAELKRLLGERVLVLDGAWGTMLQGAKLKPEDYRGDLIKADHPQDVTGDPDVLMLTRPDVILDIHRQYLAAGADITTTNTFTATSIAQADYGLEAYVKDMNVRGAQLARQAADEAAERDGKIRFVAGSESVRCHVRGEMLSNRGVPELPEVETHSRRNEGDPCDLDIG